MDSWELPCRFLGVGIGDLPYLGQKYVGGMHVIVHICKSTVKYTYDRRNKEQKHLGTAAVFTPNLRRPARSYILVIIV